MEDPETPPRKKPSSGQNGNFFFFKSHPRQGAKISVTLKTLNDARVMIPIICPFNQSGTCPVIVPITFTELDVVSLLQQINTASGR